MRRSNGRRELVAVNADRRESDLDLIPKETLSVWENTGEGTATAAGSVAVESKPHSIGLYVLFVAFVLAVAESLVAGGYLAIKKEAA